MSAVFGREPSRPLPGGDVDEARDDAPAAEPVVVEVPEGDEPAPVGEPDPAVDLRPDDVDDTIDVDDTTSADDTDDEVLDIDDLDDDDEDLGDDDLGEDEDLGIEDLDDDDDLDDTDPTGGPPAFDGDEPEPVPEPTAIPVAGTAADPPVDDGWLRRWDELQATFVDDPRAAVDGAAALLSEALSQATPGDAGTEDLRVAFRRYRAAFRDLHPVA
ncbi:MAG TPA: hypothetical protein VFM27_00555 [Acidimicrobiales bacterium]|nr:hypothetical protein [Acidimicrobiales bacterium]